MTGIERKAWSRTSGPILQAQPAPLTVLVSLTFLFIRIFPHPSGSAWILPFHLIPHTLSEFKVFNLFIAAGLSGMYDARP
jgi:hypothetical protein